MNTQTTDVMIHTRTSMSEDQFSEVARQVRALDGVLRFERNHRVPTCIMVAYETGRIRALRILNKITRLGFHATLVGM